MSKPEPPCLPECGCVCGHDNDWHALAAGACRSYEICNCIEFVARAHAPACPNAPKAEAPPKRVASCGCPIEKRERTYHVQHGATCKAEAPLKRKVMIGARPAITALLAPEIVPAEAPCDCFSRVLDDGLPATSHRTSCQEHPWQVEAHPDVPAPPAPKNCDSQHKGYQCTLDHGHEGRHEAHGGVRVIVWTDPVPPAPKPECEHCKVCSTSACCLCFKLTDNPAPSANVSEPRTLSQSILSAERYMEKLKDERDMFEARCDALKAQNAALTAELERLRDLIVDEWDCTPKNMRMYVLTYKFQKAVEEIRAAREAGKA